MMFTIILVILIQKENKKNLIVFDEMIADNNTNKKFQVIIKYFSDVGN